VETGAGILFLPEMTRDHTRGITNLVFSELGRNLLLVVPSACRRDDKATDLAALSS